MVLVGSRHVHQNEESDSGQSHSDSDYPMSEGEEGGNDDEGDDEEVGSGKEALTPLWKYVTKVQDGRGGGTAKWICPHGCRPKPYTGSYTRVRRHLCGVLDSDEKKGGLGVKVCTKMTQTEKENYIKIEEAAIRLSKRQKLQADAPSPYSASSSVGGRSSPSGSGSGSKRTLEDLFDVTGREEVDAKVARFLYACGVPFNVLRSPYWHAMVKAINKAPAGYRSPGYEKARTVLLEKEKSKVKRALTRFTDGWTDSGVSIVSDGWTNVRNQHLINILGVSSTGAVFLGAHDSSSISATSQNIADILLKTIDEVGPINVIQVITDNAANCKAAGKIIEEKYPHIFWSGCLVHTLNLLMHDIIKHKECTWMNVLYKRGKKLIKFITGHTRVNAFYGTYSKLKLLKLAKTRFGSYFLTFRRLLRVRQALGAMVMSDEWDEISTDREGMDAAKDTVLDSSFWTQVRYCLQFTKPIYNMIRFADSDQPVIGEVYEQMDTMLGLMKDIVHPRDPQLYDFIRKTVEKRWEKLNIPLHCLAYVLTPKYYHISWLSTPAAGGGGKKKPHQDSEVQTGYMQALEKMYPDSEECDKIRRQLSQYISCTGAFGSNSAYRDRANLPSLQWWDMHGANTPELCAMAMRVLSQVVNTSSAERCWSTYSFIHSVKRNRLNVQRAESLVYVHYNLRLLSHYCNDPTIEPTNKMWDYNPEEDNLEDGALVLEELENSLLEEDERAEMPPPSATARPRGGPPLSTVVPVPALEGPSQLAASSSQSLPPRVPPRGNRGGGSGRTSRR